MALRTNKTLVKEVLGGQYNELRCADLKPFIAAASGMVNWVTTTCDEDSINDSTQLELIERWLAAHFYGVSEQLLQSKSQGGASGSFQGTSDKGLGSTQFGQQAMIMDLSGCLAKRNQEMIQGYRNKAGMHWLGLNPSEKQTAAQRDGTEE